MGGCIVGKIKAKICSLLDKVKKFLVTTGLLLIIGFVVYRIAQTYIPKIEKETERTDRLGKINKEIEQERNQEDMIYNKMPAASGTTIREQDSNEISIDEESNVENLCTILPTIVSMYEEKQYRFLYQHVAIDVMEAEQFTTDYETFKEKQELLIEATSNEKATLLFHDITKIGGYYICPVSIVGIKKQTGMNVLYDYDNAIEAVFTVYIEGDSFTYLPFNIMFGKPMDVYSIVTE